MTRLVPGRREVLERLWPLYVHDLSGHRGILPDAEGRMPTGRLESYLRDDGSDTGDKACLLVEHDGLPVGFVLLRHLESAVAVLGEFFVVRAVRRTGVGRTAALAALRSRPGVWELAFQEANAPAAAFWRRVAAEASADGTWLEDVRPVPGRASMPPDTWLRLTVPRR